ncbi:hypothetical protein HPP92_011564 [Vanilla planifolia]|uniref:Uncharacterized protein n=1 Tax=Vanilla planifolia TaxID=51239 RepID=A0A835R0V1_VANPL|nr:hypothetical protein HPP92_011564 [Vanilla planifolia]
MAEAGGTFIEHRGLQEQHQKISDGHLLLLALHNRNRGRWEGQYSYPQAIQFDNFEPKERMKFSFFNWWCFAQFIGPLLLHRHRLHPRERQLVTWAHRFYRHRLPSGNPFTRLAMVLWLLLRGNGGYPPVHPWELHELDDVQYAKEGKHRINHTASVRFDLSTQALKEDYFLNPFDSCLRVLDKAAVKAPHLTAEWDLTSRSGEPHGLLDRHDSPRPCGVRQAVRALPEERTGNLGDHFAAEDRSGSSDADRHLGHRRVNREVEASRCGESWADRREYDGSPDRLRPPPAVHSTRDHRCSSGWERWSFSSTRRRRMKSLGSSLFTLSLGIGGFLSSFLLSTVTKVTGEGGRKPWVQNNLNVSHLDYYYGLLAVLNAVNFVFFLVVAMNYMYSGETFQTERKRWKQGEGDGIGGKLKTGKINQLFELLNRWDVQTELYRAV